MNDSPFADSAQPGAAKPQTTKPTPVRPRNAKGQLISTKDAAAAGAEPRRSTLSGVPLPEPEPQDSDLQDLHRQRTGQMRKPLSTRRKKLDYPEIPGFVCRWINDMPGRIKLAREAGYVHVEEDGKPVEQLVGTSERGGALNSYLMKIPQEFYDADFAAKQERLNVVDRQIYKGVYKQEAGSNQYVPEGGIKIGVQRGR